MLLGKVPIFIIVRDRLKVFKESLESILALKNPTEIVIHDNQTTFGPTLDFLNDLEKSGIKIYRSNENLLSSVNHSIHDWLKNNPCNYYAVTDPDIQLLNSDSLEIYKYLLDKYEVNAVGPQLMIQDIPDHYVLKEFVIKKHGKNFWSQKPKVDNGISYIDKHDGKTTVKIDTTFALYRGDFPFKRINDAIRVYPPYAAKHLDWYIDLNNMTEDQFYYMMNCSKEANYGGSLLKTHMSAKISLL